MKVIDSHSHIYLEQFKEDIDEVISRAQNAGVEKIVLPNIDDTTITQLLNVCNQWSSYCFPLIGLHPTSVKEDYQEKLDNIKKELDRNTKRYIGIGEIGMDLYWDQSYLKEQRVVFKEQLNWAKTHDLPVVIHSRDAFSEIFSILDTFEENDITGVFHSFTGTKEELKKALSYEHFFVGINGISTFKNSSLAKLISMIPQEKLLLETDAPYLAPTPMRGKRNEPSYIVHTLIKLAEIYSLSAEELGLITIKNTNRLFRKLK